MTSIPRWLLALAILLMTVAEAEADESVPMLWVPDALADVRAVVAKTRAPLFAVARGLIDNAVVKPIRRGRPMLRAIVRSTGERGVLRPRALRSTRCVTDHFLGVALFAGRERFTSAGGASTYGLEGGAAIRLIERIDLTARYRMLSYESDRVLSQLEPEMMGAPIVGFAFEF